MSYIGNQPLYTSYVTDRFSGNGTTLAYTLSIAPANSASLLVAIYGVLQDPNAYGVVNNTLTFSSAPPTGTNNISVRYLGLPSSNVVTSAYRTVTDIIATAGQTTFSPASYTPGFIDVYRNGSKLATADYTATNGAQVVLLNAAAAGDIIQTVGFSVGSVLNAIPANAGVINSGYLADASVTSTKLSSTALDSVSGTGVGAMQLPTGTTAQRPGVTAGRLRFNTTSGAIEYSNATTWASLGLADGSSFSAAAPSASYIKSINPSVTDGVYWLNFSAGSGSPFPAYIVFSKPDGPWVKAVQWNSGVDLSGSAAVNVNGAWTTNQIGLAAGKLVSADINVLKTSLSTMWRVTGGGGGSDPLMNNGAGTLKINFSALPNWGTDAQPQAGQNYDIYLDNASDGTYEYGYRYGATVQGRCNHTTSIWISDHSSPPGAGSQTLVALPPYSNMAICWTVGSTGWYTNMHPWSGIATQSGGSIPWGTAAGTACSIFFKN